MDRERAETHLRLLAEAELRRATSRPADGGLLDECPAPQHPPAHLVIVTTYAAASVAS